MLTPGEVDLSIGAYAEREKRLDLRAGVIAATVANVNRDKKKRPKPYIPADFFADLEDKRPRRPQTPEEQRDALMRVARLSGAQVKRVSQEEFDRMVLGG